MKINMLNLIGQFLLTFSLTGIAINTFVLDNNYVITFIVGLFMGVSLVFNLTYFIC